MQYFSTLRALPREGPPIQVLVIAADPSPRYFTAAARDARVAQLKDGRCEVIPGGHHLHMEQAARVAAPLLRFLG